MTDGKLVDKKIEYVHTYIHTQKGLNSYSPILRSLFSESIKYCADPQILVHLMVILQNDNV